MSRLGLVFIITAVASIFFGCSGAIAEEVREWSSAQHSTPDAVTPHSRLLTGLPNLAPYQPAGWSDKIIVSTSMGTHSDSSFLDPTDTLYADWAVINSGDAAVDTPFSTRLFVDDQLRMTWGFSEPPLTPGSYTSIDDFSIGMLAPGIHRIRVQADSQNQVFEGDDEGDNEYIKIIVVGPPVQITSCLLQPPGDHLELTWTYPSTLMCRVWWSSNLAGWSMEHSTPTAQGGAWTDTGGPPWPGTFYRVSVTDFTSTTRDHIEASPVSASPISGDDTNNLLDVGAILFCHTSEGRFAKFQVEGTGYNLTITWKTYNPDGSTHGSGSGLLIRGTWSCDLDEGEEVGADATRDFQWNQLTTTERNLLPRNGALFFKAY